MKASSRLIWKDFFLWVNEAFLNAERERVYSCRESGRLFVTPRLFDSCLCVAVGNISAPGWVAVMVVIEGG